MTENYELWFRQAINDLAKDSLTTPTDNLNPNFLISEILAETPQYPRFIAQADWIRNNRSLCVDIIRELLRNHV